MHALAGRISRCSGQQSPPPPTHPRPGTLGQRREASPARRDGISPPPCGPARCPSDQLSARHAVCTEARIGPRSLRDGPALCEPMSPSPALPSAREVLRANMSERGLRVGSEARRVRLAAGNNEWIGGRLRSPVHQTSAPPTQAPRCPARPRHADPVARPDRGLRHPVCCDVAFPFGHNHQVARRLMTDGLDPLAIIARPWYNSMRETEPLARVGVGKSRRVRAGFCAEVGTDHPEPEPRGRLSLCGVQTAISGPPQLGAR